MTTDELLALAATADTDPRVRVEYRGKGNWDVYLDDKYQGTYWIS